MKHGDRIFIHGSGHGVVDIIANNNGLKMIRALMDDGHLMWAMKNDVLLSLKERPEHVTTS